MLTKCLFNYKICSRVKNNALSTQEIERQRREREQAELQYQRELSEQRKLKVRKISLFPNRALLTPTSLPGLYERALHANAIRKAFN